MLRKLSTIAITVFLLINGLQAQNTNATSEKAHHEAMKKLETMSSEEIGNYYKKYHSRLPFNKEQQEKLLKTIPTKAAPQTKSTKSVEMPDNFWFPGEFEELQAIVMTWPYLTLNPAKTRYVMPVNDSLGYYIDYNNGNAVVSKYISIIDTTTNSRMPVIFSEIANAVQKGNAQVWINLYNIADTGIVKRYMENKNMPLTNYLFFGFQGNSIWYRDCGPVAFYYGAEDSIAFLDFEYYSGRAMDDLLPIRLGETTNIPVYTTSLEYEGGNVLLDGAGTLFTSDQLYATNMDRYGQIYIENNTIYSTPKSALTKKQIQDSLKHLFGLSRLEILPTLEYDGGTGHIDLYAALWDESNLVYTQYPDAMQNNIDYFISSSNVDSILSLKTYYQKNYRGKNIPLPRKDTGSWYNDAADFSKYTRTYSNSTFVNNVIIQPIFSDKIWGDTAWDNKSLEIMKKDFPGYEIIPIDIRGYKNDPDLSTGFDGTGGAIHCVTKQIPAENPIRIMHGSIQGMANTYNGNFPIEATITNKSGIASATCFWRQKGASNWTGSDMMMQVSSNNKFSFTIERDANVKQDTIEYYISATSVNGKTITKPITAPKGSYSFYFGSEVTPETPDSIYGPADTLPINPKPAGIDLPSNSDGIAFGNFYPNPANRLAQLQITNVMPAKMDVKMVDAFGKMVYTNTFSLTGNYSIFELNTSSFKTGIYTVLFTDKAGNITTRRLIIGK